MYNVKKGVRILANKIKLTVGGMDLYINTDDNEAYMQAIGNEVNKRILDITRNSSFISTTMACVVAALEYCDEAKKTKIDTKEMEDKINSLGEEVATARLESDEARREIERLNKENQLLRAKLSRQWLKY